MFKGNQPPPVSPSMESLPQFIRSPVVPRFNSPFPPLHPDKKYRGVYERAGFEVYKGDYAKHKHSHDPNNPSECNSMGTPSAKNSPSPNNDAKFPRNFTAPNPFGKSSTRSDSSLLAKDRHSQNSGNSEFYGSRQRNASESSLAASPSPFASKSTLPAKLPTSTSTASFNYASAYSTPVVDSQVVKSEDISINNYISPPRDQASRGYDSSRASNMGHSTQPSFDSSRPDNLSHSKQPSFENTTNHSSFENSYSESSYSRNEYQFPSKDDSGLQLRVPGTDYNKIGHESVTSVYSDRESEYRPTPRLSELIEEEIGATPTITVSDEFETNSYEATPTFLKQETFQQTPAILIDEAEQVPQQEQFMPQENEIISDEEEVSSNSVLFKKKPTMSTYMNRDQAYDLLTGGEVPTKTPDLPSGAFNAQGEPISTTQEEIRSFSVTPETDFDNYPSNETSMSSEVEEFNIDQEINSLAKDLSASIQLEDGMTPEMKQELEGKFVHHKILDEEDRIDAKTIKSDRSLERDEASSVSESLPSVKRQIFAAGTGPCRKCSLDISGKSIWSKDGQLSGQWHRNCFGCHSCGKLFNKGTNCYVIDDFPYCEQHFHELNNSICKTCGRGIEGLCLENEKSEKFHPECLCCHICGTFISKDYFMVDGLPLCERDGLVELEKEKNLLLGSNATSKIEKRRTRLLQI